MTSCELCAVTFPSRGDLREHMQRQHTRISVSADEQYGCSACGRSFFSREDLERHATHVHSPL